MVGPPWVPWGLGRHVSHLSPMVTTRGAVTLFTDEEPRSSDHLAEEEGRAPTIVGCWQGLGRPQEYPCGDSDLGRCSEAGSVRCLALCGGHTRLSPALSLHLLPPLPPSLQARDVYEEAIRTVMTVAGLHSGVRQLRPILREYDCSEDGDRLELGREWRRGELGERSP